MKSTDWKRICSVWGSCCPSCVFALMDAVTSPPLPLLLLLLLLLLLIRFSAPPHVWLKLWNNRQPDSGRNAAAAGFCIRASLSQSLKAWQPQGPSLAPSSAACLRSHPGQKHKKSLQVWPNPHEYSAAFAVLKVVVQSDTDWLTNDLFQMLPPEVQVQKKTPANYH